MASVHPGKACEDPECPFRAPISQAHQRTLTPIADELRAAAANLRRKLGLKTSYAEEETPRAKKEDAPHFCHVPTCKEPCSRAHLMCGPHWFLVPRELQRAVLRAYLPGQEEGRAPVTEAYLAVARAAIEAVLRHERDVATGPEPEPDPQLVLFK